MMKVLVGLILVIVAASVGLTWNRWEGQPPEIAFDRDFASLGREPALTLTVQDQGTGLKQVVVRLNDVVLVEESLDGSEKSKTYDIGRLAIEKKALKEGAATIVASASDQSLRNFLGGNTTELRKDFTYDTIPPRLEVLSSQHYINQGGAECVVYRVGEDVKVSGVQAGPNFFPGYPANLPDKQIHFALFGFVYDMPVDAPLKVIARDEAGNESTATFWNKVFAKNFRRRDIVLEDNFLNKVVPEIRARVPEIQDQGEMIKTFVEINSTLRKQNHETITRLSKESSGRFLWNGAFLQLSNSQVESFFADRRSYLYQGQKVDQQDHVGFDLSVTQQYPIEAANDGKVIMADYFGIYGNTVLIDHGAGLISLYGHLSSIDVKPGDMVKKKQVLGRSGATGMAGGDHLHFGLFLHGVPINPTEWWDEKWIREHVLDRLRG
jgi:murein DD-endopeptidase MepM/ murein hydrolase activator NlpD